ncbi:MAG: hypothetical protein P1S46_00675 [bacterium]|nr:hypothetical protein [bacterium]MDT8395525.1 hypothetical protein [bacterium]
MKGRPASRSGIRGQVLILAVLVLGLCCTLLLGLFTVSAAVQQKIRLQLTADMAVLSVLNHQANTLNSIALANRAILANDALAAQLNALSCESRFYRRFVEKFQKYLKFVPYVGPALTFISQGARSMELLVKRSASLILPFCRGANSLLGRSQQFIRKLLPLNSLKVAQRSIEENMPGSEMPAPGKLLLLTKARQIQKSLEPIPMEKAAAVRRATMDSHTLKRNWRVSVGGFSPIKKTGGLNIPTGDLQAQDKLRIKVFKRLRWRWKTALSEKNLASDLGYKAPERIISLNRGKNTEFTLPLALQWNFSGELFGEIDERNFLALSAGRLFYHRESHPEEQPNVFNPFWKTQLIPVASEPTAKKIVPKMILEEIRH